MSKPDPIPYSSPFPECRVTATVDPFGMVRLDVSRERAALYAKQVRERLEAHSGGLMDVMFQMDRRAYTHLSENLSQILETDAEGVQVVLDGDPEVSIMVLLNESQIRKLDATTSRAIQNPGDTFAWQVSTSENGAELLIQQVVAALNGEDDPLDATEDAIRDGDRDE